MIVKGKEVQQKEKNNGKEEKTMAEGNVQCNGIGERAMEGEKINLKEQCQRGENNGRWERSTTQGQKESLGPRKKRE